MRRPGLRVIFSDNGTNFRGADNELKHAVRDWNVSVPNDLRSRGIEWKFGPPHSSHWGGVWERLIREAKKHLSVLLSRSVLDLDMFATVLVGVEQIMNNRPLTYASSDIRDLTTLCPADFLHPGIRTHTSIHVYPPKPPGADTLRYVWKKTRALIDEFWDRWAVEYLHTLQKRYKWQSERKNLYVGQIVLLYDELTKRDRWPLGRVIAVKTDGNTVRDVTVQTANGKQYLRHVTKVIPLELE